MPIDKKELLAALRDQQVLNFLRSQIIQTATTTGIGRIPGQGSAQNDNYVYPDAADANFPYNFDYEIPGNFQRIISARLSFKIRPYRTYSSLTLSATGNASNDHTHTGGTTGTESATHNHTINYDNSNGATAVFLSSVNAGKLSNNLPVASDSGSTLGTENATHTHSGGISTGQSATHTHTVSGTTTLAIAEDVAPANPGITVKVDGSDVTSKIGGPFNGDMIEVDVTQVLKTSAKVWHVMSLQPNQRVRITGILRISYLIDSRLAQ